jgi:hypothetical protein
MYQHHVARTQAFVIKPPPPLAHFCLLSLAATRRRVVSLVWRFRNTSGNVRRSVGGSGHAG